MKIQIYDYLISIYQLAKQSMKALHGKLSISTLTSEIVTRY
jgi:hypothetical protein